MRHKTLKGFIGMCALYDAREEFTHRIDLPNGVVLRGDPANCFWGQWSDRGHMTWNGSPPDGWDDSIAVEDNFSRTFEMEVDVS